MQYNKEELEAYIELVNEVNPKLFRERNIGGGKKIKFIPIDTMESLIDRVFSGLIKDIDFQITPFVNEIIGVYKGEYFHPVIKEWIPIIGVAAIPVQQAAESKITDFESTKIKNALEYCAPNLYERAKTSAFGHIGRLFGRGINRNEDQKHTAKEIYGKTENQIISERIDKGDINFTDEQVKFLLFSKELTKKYYAKKKELGK